MQSLMGIAVALMAGLLLSRVVKVLRLPAVTGYLIAGILIGPYCLGRLGIPGLGFTKIEGTETNLYVLDVEKYENRECYIKTKFRTSRE